MWRSATAMTERSWSCSGSRKPSGVVEGNLSPQLRGDATGKVWGRLLRATHPMRVCVDGCSTPGHPACCLSKPGLVCPSHKCWILQTAPKEVEGSLMDGQEGRRRRLHMV